MRQLTTCSSESVAAQGLEPEPGRDTTTGPGLWTLDREVESCAACRALVAAPSRGLNRCAPAAATAWCAELPANRGRLDVRPCCWRSRRVNVFYDRSTTWAGWAWVGAREPGAVADDCDRCPACNAPPSVDCPCDDRRAFDQGVL